MFGGLSGGKAYAIFGPWQIANPRAPAGSGGYPWLASRLRRRAPGHGVRAGGLSARDDQWSGHRNGQWSDQWSGQWSGQRNGQRKGQWNGEWRGRYRSRSRTLAGSGVFR